MCDIYKSYVRHAFITSRNIYIVKDFNDLCNKSPYALPTPTQHPHLPFLSPTIIIYYAPTFVIFATTHVSY